MQPRAAPVACKRYTQLHYTSGAYHSIYHYCAKTLFPLDFHFQILNVTLALQPFKTV